MHWKIGLMPIVVLLFMLTSPINAVADGKGPHPAKVPLAEDGALQLSPEDRCPVCGMFPAKRPRNAAGMLLADGRGFYFCGNGCLLRTYRHSRQYIGVAPEEIKRMVVQSYFRGAPLDARKAWWVKGSDVVGPMGPALVALEDEAAVKTFQERHGGKVVFQIDRLDEEQWQQILPKKKH